jgi:hypothetical protein
LRKISEDVTETLELIFRQWEGDPAGAREVLLRFCEAITISTRLMRVSSGKSLRSRPFDCRSAYAEVIERVRQ